MRLLLNPNLFIADLSVGSPGTAPSGGYISPAPWYATPIAITPSPQVPRTRARTNKHGILGRFLTYYRGSGRPRYSDYGIGGELRRRWLVSGLWVIVVRLPTCSPADHGRMQHHHIADMPLALSLLLVVGLSAAQVFNTAAETKPNSSQVVVGICAVLMTLLLSSVGLCMVGLLGVRVMEYRRASRLVGVSRDG